MTIDHLLHAQTCCSCGKPVGENHVSYFKSGHVTKVQHRECLDKEERDEFRHSGKITTGLMMSALLNVEHSMHVYGIDDEIKEAVDRLQEDVSRLCIEAWFGGVSSTTEYHQLLRATRLVYPRTKDSLQSIIEDSPHRTLEAKHKNLVVTGQEMAGRALLQIESNDERITLIVGAKQQDNGMGIQGIEGTEKVCRHMLNEVRCEWRKLVFKAVR